MFHHPRRLLLAFLFLFSGLGATHELEVLPPIIPPSPPVMPLIPTLRVQGAEQPVGLQSLAMTVAVQGGFAEVSLDMTFFNPNRRILEGELRFPLLPGQEISGLSLDISGEMRDGVPVPKARGQEIFDAVVRRNVDPALLEAAEGNMYKLRLYPIPASGTRRVIVRTLQPLEQQDGVSSLRLPLPFAKHLDAFSVEAVVASEEPPRVDAGALGLTLHRAGTLYRGRVEKKDISPEGVLEINLPVPPSAVRDCEAVEWRDKIYFAAAASVPVRRAARRVPDNATILWDASGSGRNRDHAREYALLDKYFTAMGDGRVRVVALRDRADAPRDFTVRKGDWSEIKAHLHGLIYDGGTDLASWTPAPDCAEYLLFSDGLANYGKSRQGRPLPPLPAGNRLYAVTASVAADHTLLRHASGGRLIDLLRLDDAAAAALLLEDRTAVSLAPATLAGRGEALLDPLSGVAEAGTDRLPVRLAGWATARKGASAETISLRLDHPDGTSESLPFALPPVRDVERHDGNDAPLYARLWGRYAIAEMEAYPDRHRATIARLGQELGIVSRETSLIVLETAEDYARFDVTPPESLKAEVARLRARTATPANSVTSMPIEKLVRMWSEKVSWWERDFSKTRRGKKAPVIPEDSTRAYSLEDPPVSTSFMENDPRGMADRETDRSFRVLGRNAVDMDASVSPMDAALRVRPRASAPAAMRAPAEEAKSGADPAGDSTREPAAAIALQPWRSDAPYIARMNRAKKEDMYAIYLDERPGHEQSSAFYLDMADRFFKAGLPELALRVLSNLAEIGVENRQLLRVLAYRLLEADQPLLAFGVLEKVRELAPYEPQSLRDLARAHIALGNAPEAADLLYEVATREWDARFQDINTIALTELGALLAASGVAVDAAKYDSRLIRSLACDLRVVLGWDADNTDMDLWVTDPNGEKCFYQHRLTRQGGAMTRDCTDGYGPEEFMLKKAKPGVYRVEVDYYGNHRQTVSGEVTVYVTFTTGFGTPRQKDQTVTLRLQGEKKTILAGEFTVD